MVIGFDGSRAFTSKRTGTENYSYQLLKHLLKIDKTNKYLVYVRPGTEYETIVAKNVNYQQIRWLRFWTQGGLAVQTFKDDLDVLFVPAHTLPLIRKPGLKTVVTVHDLGSEYLPQMHQLKQQLYLSYMQRHQLKSATKLIAVSKATKNDLVNRIGITPEKIEVVYEGYDKSLLKPIKGDILVNSLRQYGLVPGKYFLFVGTVQPRKNLERLIEAFNVIATLPMVARNDGLKLVIVGQKGWLADEIYRLPNTLNIANKVKFLGYAPDKDMPALYSGAIALTFPSLFEGFGLPILEAQACGCPVIISNVSSMPEVAGGAAIYVNPLDVGDIVRGMEKCQMSNVKCQMAKEGFENIKKFSWEKCAAQTLKVLEELRIKN